MGSKRFPTLAQFAFGIALLVPFIVLINVLCKPTIAQTSPPAEDLPNSYPTASWEVYTDTVYGYSIKYPSGFYLYPTSPDAAGKGGVAQITNYDRNSRLNQAHRGEISQRVFKVEVGIMDARKPAGQTLRDWMDKVIGSEIMENETPEELNVGGTDSIKLSTEIGDFSSTVIYVPREDIVYFIYTMSTSSDSFSDTFALMLQSFHFHDKRIPLTSSPTTSTNVKAQNATSDPVNFRLPFDGQRIRITAGPGEYMHTGNSKEAIDFALAGGHQVLAAEAGTVIVSEHHGAGEQGFGNIILIAHADGTTSYYAHLSTRHVGVDIPVTKGQLIGLSGDTGMGGYHLHFEVRRNASGIGTGKPEWIRDIPGISWNIKDGKDCPPCEDYDDGAASSDIDTTIVYSIRFQGINFRNDADSKHVKFRVATTSPPERYFYSTASYFLAEYVGRVSLADFSPGIYNVLIKGPAHLQKRRNNVDLPPGIVLRRWGDTPLRAGDVIIDNKITIEDIATVLRFYTDLSRPVDPNDPEMVICDLNSDRLIDIMDVALSLMNYTDLEVPGDDWDTLTQQQSTAFQPTNYEYPLLGLGSSMTSTEQTVNWLWPVNISESIGDSTVPAVAIDNDNTVHVVWADNTSGSYEIFYTSRSNTANWSKPVSTTLSTGGVYPAIAADSNGGVHLVWSEGGLGTDIYYSYITESGQWSTPANVSNTSSYSRYPAIAIDSNDTLHVVWIDNTPGGLGNSEILYASRSASEDWSDPVNISNDSSNSIDPDIAIDSNNTLHVVWEGILYTKKPMGGSWSIPQAISPGSAGFDPTVAIDDNDTLHVAWRDSGVFYINKPVDLDWSSSTEISNRPGGFWPDIAAGSDSSIHAVWMYSSEVLYANKGSSLAWTEPYTISNNHGGASGPQPTIAVNDLGMPYVVFRDESSGNREINYTFSIPSEGIAPLTLVPDTADVAAGDAFPVEIHFDTRGIAVSALTFYLTYQIEGTILDLEVLDADPEQEGIQVQINQALSQDGWAVHGNEVSVDSGIVTIKLAISNSSFSGYSVSSDTLLATINFRANCSFSNKVLSFDLIETRMLSKLDAINTAQIQGVGSYSATGDSCNTYLYLPVILRNN